MGEKYCKYCKQFKPFPAFSFKQSGKFGLQAFCRKCRQNTSSGSAGRKRYSKLELRGWWLIARYGINLDEFDTMLSKQCGQCAICGTTPNENLTVDHCHRTGNVRGLLCRPCNSRLAIFDRGGNRRVRCDDSWGVDALLYLQMMPFKVGSANIVRDAVINELNRKRYAVKRMLEVSSKSFA